jgi:hypothetical protein
VAAKLRVVAGHAWAAFGGGRVRCERAGAGSAWHLEEGEEIGDILEAEAGLESLRHQGESAGREAADAGSRDRGTDAAGAAEGDPVV